MEVLIEKQLAEAEWWERKKNNYLCINTTGVSALRKFLPLPNETSITKPLTAEQLAECPADKHRPLSSLFNRVPLFLPTDGPLKKKQRNATN